MSLKRKSKYRTYTVGLNFHLLNIVYVLNFFYGLFKNTKTEYTPEKTIMVTGLENTGRNWYGDYFLKIHNN